MRFENINRRKCLVLDRLDGIYLTTEEYVGSKVIKVECDGSKLRFSGTGEIAEEIVGEDMLEKVTFPKLLSKEEVIEKCDIWLEMFKKVHDTFCSLVLTKKYQEEKVGMTLLISNDLDEFDKTKEKRKISLALMTHQNMIQKGVSISTVGEENETLFPYLALHVVKHYLSKNYNKFIQYSEDSLSFLLTSDYVFAESEIQPMVLYIGCSKPSTSYLDFFRRVFSSHNLGLPISTMEVGLTDCISNQYLSASFLDDYHESLRQYENLITSKKEDTRKVYEKAPKKSGIDGEKF